MPVQPTPPRPRVPRADGPIARAKAHRALSPSKRAESGYVLALLGIMGRVHATVLRDVVPRPDDPERRHDGSDPRLLRRLFRLVEEPTQTAFDAMATHANKGSAKGAALVGIRPASVPGLGGVVVAARAKNVRLIKNATEDFLQDVEDVLADNEGAHADVVAKALQDRVDVSKSRATLIARDQTTKTVAALNEHRQRAAGISRFRWSAVKDERTREAHLELDGQVFDWDEGLPADVADDVGEEAGVTPGEPVCCRCVAVPVLGFAAGDEDEAEAAGSELGMAAE